MTEAAKAKGLTEIGVFVIMLLTVQGFFGIPLLGATGFLFAICVSAFLVIRNIYYKIRRRR